MQHAVLLGVLVALKGKKKRLLSTKKPCMHGVTMGYYMQILMSKKATQCAIQSIFPTLHWMLARPCLFGSWNLRGRHVRRFATARLRTGLWYRCFPPPLPGQLWCDECKHNSKSNLVDGNSAPKSVYRFMCQLLEIHWNRHEIWLCWYSRCWLTCI